MWEVPKWHRERKPEILYMVDTHTGVGVDPTRPPHAMPPPKLTEGMFCQVITGTQEKRAT